MVAKPQKGAAPKAPPKLTAKEVDEAERKARELEEDQEEQEEGAPVRAAKPRAKGKGKSARVLLPRGLVRAGAETPLHLANVATMGLTARFRKKGAIVPAAHYDPELKEATLDIAEQALGEIEVPIGWALLISYVATYITGLIGALLVDKLAENPEAAAALMAMLAQARGQPFPGATPTTPPEAPNGPARTATVNTPAAPAPGPGGGAAPTA